MRIYILAFFLLFATKQSFSQSISCDDLLRYVQQEGYNFSSVGRLALTSSSWLREVKAYSLRVDYEEIIFVVAEIKRDNSIYSYSYDTYIFCGIPRSNWNRFRSISYGQSYGEKFHAYIMDYVCDCN